MSASKPFISFVIPVFNAEQNLQATLDSILQQNDGSFEIICIDDGSTDDSGKILDAYAGKNPCVFVTHQKNQGITSARNAGLRQAHGVWVCFVDNDDILAKTAVSVIHQTAQPDCDIVYYTFQRFSTDLPAQGEQSTHQSAIIEGTSVNKLQSDCINRFRKNTPIIPHSVLPTPWAKVYRRDFLNKYRLQFREDVTHEEDIIFNFEVLAHVRRAKTVNYVLYYYRWSTQSESHRYRPQIFQSALATLAAYQDIIKCNYAQRPDIIELYQYRILWELQYCVFLGPMHENNPASYSERKKQFIFLRNYPPFSKACSTLNMHRFEPRQTILSILIKYRQFWILNILGKIIGKIR